MREFHGLADSRGEILRLGFWDRRRRDRVQNHKSITAYLGEDIPIAKHVAGRNRAGRHSHPFSERPSKTCAPPVTGRARNPLRRFLAVT